MFIENENVFNFHLVESKTLEEIKEDCFKDFFTHLMDYVIQPGCENPVILKSSLINYKEYENKYSRKISYNNKNRQFSQLFTDLKKYVSNKLYENINGENNIYYIESRTTNELIGIKIEETGISDYKSVFCIKDFMELFGKGEFPFMWIYIVRLGNHDYYFYKLTR